MPFRRGYIDRGLLFLITSNMNREEFYYIDELRQYIRLKDIQSFKLVDHSAYQVCTIKLTGPDYLHVDILHYWKLESIFNPDSNE